MKKTLHNTSGFTLIEILVAVGIFSVVTVIVSGIFLNVNNLQQNTANYQRLQNDGRYIVEKMAREIRGRELILPRNIAANPTSTLSFLEDESGQAVTISYDAVNKNLNYIVNGVSQKINSEDVMVNSMKFYILPTVDPFSGDPTPDTQPRVTLLMQLENKVANPKFMRRIDLQTTISSKIYKR